MTRVPNVFFADPNLLFPVSSSLLLLLLFFFDVISATAAFFLIPLCLSTSGAQDEAAQFFFPFPNRRYDGACVVFLFLGSFFFLFKSLRMRFGLAPDGVCCQITLLGFLLHFRSFAS